MKLRMILSPSVIVFAMMVAGQAGAETPTSPEIVAEAAESAAAPAGGVEALEEGEATAAEATEIAVKPPSRWTLRKGAGRHLTDHRYGRRYGIGFHHRNSRHARRVRRCRR